MRLFIWAKFLKSLKYKSASMVHPILEQVNIPQRLQNFINGEFMEPISEQYIDNYEPATGNILSRIPESAHEDVELAVQAAKEAFPKWRDLSAKERSMYLERIAEELRASLYRLAAIESADTGKPFTLAYSLDIPRAIDNFSFFAGAILHESSESHMTGGGLFNSNINSAALNYTQTRPVGVAGLIVPWNLPLYLLSWKVAPALAYGNTVVIKPSELTPHTATELAAICKKVGLPKGVLNVVHGTGKSAGNSLVSHEDVPLISFTGGTVTGKIVAKTAAPLFKKVSLELGGKNSTVIFDDCDLENTVNIAVRASFANQGQVCLCGSRVLVQESIYESFMEKFVEKVRQLAPGNPYAGFDPNNLQVTHEKTTQLPTPPATLTFGSLISAAHREKIESYEIKAREEGGIFVLGGHRPNVDDLPDGFKNGYFYTPTIVTGLSPSSPISVEEIFGPFIVVHKFKTEEEALEIANGTKYGLAGAVFTSNLTRAHRFSQRWETGMVWINTWLLRDLRVPFGGVKQSGIGFEGGNYSKEFWTNPKNICVKL